MSSHAKISSENYTCKRAKEYNYFPERARKSMVSDFK